MTTIKSDQPDEIEAGYDPLARSTCTIAESARLLGIGRATAYAAVHSGDLPTVRIGRRLVVPTAALKKMLHLDGNSGGS